MGACSSAPSEIDLASFRIGKPIGKGGFGKVYVTLSNEDWNKAKKHIGTKTDDSRSNAPHLPNFNYFAIKCISKARLLGLDRPQRTSVSSPTTIHHPHLHHPHLASPADDAGPRSSHGAEADRTSAMMIWAERTIMASMRNPYLVKLLHAFQSNDELYLVMPFYVGGDVHTFLNKHTRMSEDVARVYAAEVVLALEHIHTNFYVYRDLKPLNLLFDEDGHIAVTDYGLCRMLEEDLDYRIVGRGGTRGYRAPEVANGLSYDFSCDMYSFGVTLYEMCTGRRKPQSLHPGTAQTVNDVKVNSRLSNELKDLVRRLTMPNVAERLGCELTCKRITERCKRLGVPINDFYARAPRTGSTSGGELATSDSDTPVISGQQRNVACVPAQLARQASQSGQTGGHSSPQMTSNSGPGPMTNGQANSAQPGHSRTSSQPQLIRNGLGAMPLPTSSRSAAAAAQATNASMTTRGVDARNVELVLSPQHVNGANGGRRASLGSPGLSSAPTLSSNPASPLSTFGRLPSLSPSPATNGSTSTTGFQGISLPQMPSSKTVTSNNVNVTFATPLNLDDDDDSDYPTHNKARARQASTASPTALQAKQQQLQGSQSGGQNDSNSEALDGWHDRALKEIDEDNNFLWNAVKNHPWFRGIDWDRVARREIQPGYAPKFDQRELLEALFGPDSGAPILPSGRRKGGGHGDKSTGIASGTAGSGAAGANGSAPGASNMMLSANSDDHRSLPRLSARQQELFLDFEFNIDPAHPIDLSQPAKLSERELAFLSRKNRRRDSASSVVYSRESSRMVSLSSPAISGHRSTSVSGTASANVPAASPSSPVLGANTSHEQLPATNVAGTSSRHRSGSTMTNGDVRNGTHREVASGTPITYVSNRSRGTGLASSASPYGAHASSMTHSQSTQSLHHQQLSHLQHHHQHHQHHQHHPSNQVHSNLATRPAGETTQHQRGGLMSRTQIDGGSSSRTYQNHHDQPIYGSSAFYGRSMPRG